MDPTTDKGCKNNQVPVTAGIISQQLGCPVLNALPGKELVNPIKGAVAPIISLSIE